MNTLGINGVPTLTHGERIIKNSFVTDAYGRLLVFGDLGPIEIARISKNLGNLSVVLALSEFDSTQKLKMFNNDRARQKLRTEPEEKELKRLAEHKTTSLETADILPVLTFAKMAISNNGLYYTEPYIEENYKKAIENCEEYQTFKQANDIGYLDGLVTAKNLKLNLLSPGEFAVKIASIAVREK